MRKRIVATGAVALSAILILAATGDQERLEEGDVLISTIPVDGAKFPRIHVEAMIDAEPAHVWKLLKRCELSERINSRISESAVEKRIGDDVVCREVVDMPFPFRDLTTVTRWHFEPGPPAWKRSWTLVRGDFDYSNGSWTLRPHGDGKTHAIYENHFKPQIAVPDWLSKAFLKSGMTGMIEDLRRAAK